MMNVILLGPPGVGKGTTAKMLAEKFGIPYLGTGDILRDEIAGGTELGAKAKEYVHSGHLVPDAMVTDIVKARLGQEDAKKGVFLDGYPRTAEQAKALKAFASMDKVLNFVAPKKTIIDRIKSRAQGRADDAPDVIMRRIGVYEEKTQPLIDFYRNEGILFDVDSTQDIDGVFRQCVKILEGGAENGRQDD